MEYKLEDLIDVKNLQKLMEGLYKITKIPHSLIDDKGNILIGIGWIDGICSKFHNVYKESHFKCKENDLEICNTLSLNEKLEIYKCRNGLIEAVVPIIVEDNYMGALCLGQFLFDKPDMQFFLRQAEDFGYDSEDYLKEVSKIPIFTREKVEATMTYFFHLAELLSHMGLNRLKQKETEKLLIKTNEKLEEKIAKRTAKIAIANKKLKIDIKKRKIIQKKLEESKARYQELIELIPDSIVVHNEGKICFANPSFAKLVGEESNKKLINRNILEFIHPEDRSSVIEFERYIKFGQNFPVSELKVISSDGNLIDIEATGTPFTYKGKATTLIVARDIMERKRVEKLRKKIEKEQRNLKEAREYEKIKMEFFANLSHEFRTPLNLIYSTIQIFEKDLKDKFTNEEGLNINKRMKILKQNTYRLLRLSNNLLDITKIDLGYFKINLENCNIIEKIEDITMYVAQYVRSKNIKVTFDTDIEETIMAVDVSAIQRIMLNLLSNAVKFSNHGGEIMVSIKVEDKYLCISVRDTGIGIPKDKQEIIFNRFIQVNKSLSRNHEGSGIGLALVKLLVDLHNGKVEAKSKYKKGSEFIIKLPRTQVNSKDNMGNESEKTSFEENSTEIMDIEFSDIYLLNDIG